MPYHSNQDLPDSVKSHLPLHGQESIVKLLITHGKNIKILKKEKIRKSLLKKLVIE